MIQFLTELHIPTLKDRIQMAEWEGTIVLFWMDRTLERGASTPSEVVLP